MTAFQKMVLNFWDIEKRALAVFDGQTIGPAEIKANPAMAERYWKLQLAGCRCNWDNRNYEPRQARW